MSKARLYFAYGSNMCPRQMRQRCPAAKPLGPASLEGFSFLINERGVATLCPDAGGKVHGVLWRLGRSCEAALDSYEGVALGRYRKRRLRARARSGKFTSALVYIDDRTAPGIPRPGYLARVLRGALAFELPAHYLREILDWENGGVTHAA
jgi:gamma-glutamylcyclotransferase (GGCT)/AIG2-like uncharacterized protein YtfP